MKYKIVTLFLVTLTIIACSKSDSSQKIELSNIKISDENILKGNDYSSVIDSLKAIPLETNEKSIISGVRKILFKNNKFFISDKSHNLLVFDQSGKFINKLSKKGKGPKEYIELRDFAVDDNGFIKILSWKKIITYDANLKYVDKFAFNIKTNTGRELNPIYFMPINQYFFLFMGSFGIRSFEPGKEMALYCIDKKKRIIKEYFPLDYEYTHNHKMFYNSNENFYYSDIFGNDTIYQINKSDIFPKYVVNFGNRRVSKSAMKGERTTLFQDIWDKELRGNIGNIFENTDYFCFKFTQGRTIKQVVFNKNTGKLNIFNVFKSHPFPAMKVEGTINSSFFSVVEPFMLHGMNKDGFYDELIYSQGISEIGPADNPIIFQYQFNF